MARTAEPPAVWGVAEICDQVEVSRSTVLAWQKREGFPTPAMVNRGKTAVWDRVQVLRWIAEHGGIERTREAARAQL